MGFPGEIDHKDVWASAWGSKGAKRKRKPTKKSGFGFEEGGQRAGLGASSGPPKKKAKVYEKIGRFTHGAVLIPTTITNTEEELAKDAAAKNLPKDGDEAAVEGEVGKSGAQISYVDDSTPAPVN